MADERARHEHHRRAADIVPTAPDGILTATRGVHAPPEMRDGHKARWFVVVVLVAMLCLVAAVGAVNAVVDPYGTLNTGVVGPAVWTDRQQKTQLIDRLKAAPQTVILGSSRSLKMEPSYLGGLIGRRGFNAGVSNGTPVDAYAFVRYLQDRFPAARPTYLWLLDQEAFADNDLDPGLVADPKLSAYLPGTLRFKQYATDLSWLFSWTSLRTSIDSLMHQGASAPSPSPSPSKTAQKRTDSAVFAPDGFRSYDFHDKKRAEGYTLAQGLKDSFKTFGRRYRSNFPGLAATPRRYFERALALMNDQGVRPVIVLTPVHPKLLAKLRPLGWTKRHRQVLDYLHSLQKDYDFVLLDYSTIDSFGGRPADFYDGVHMTVPNTRRLLRAVAGDQAAREALQGRTPTGQ